MPTENKNIYWDRLQAVIQRSGLSTSQFARKIGYARPEVLFQIKRGNNTISRKLTERIIACYPEIRRCWLLCGEGPMLRESLLRNEPQPPMIFYCNTTLPTCVK